MMVELSLLSVFLVLPDLFSTQYLPDISLTGKLLTDQDGTTIFQFMCSTNIPSVECTTNIQVDQQIYDDLRFISNACYHRYGKCSADVCNCSENCQTFTLNISAALGMKNRKFGCEARLKYQSYIFKAIISLKPDGKEFVIVEKVIQPIGQVDTSSHLLTTEMTPQQPDVASYLNVRSTGPYVAIGITCLACTLVAIVGIVCIWNRLSQNQNAKCNTICSRYCNMRNADIQNEDNNSANKTLNDGERKNIDKNVINTQVISAQYAPFQDRCLDCVTGEDDSCRLCHCVVRPRQGALLCDGCQHEQHRTCISEESCRQFRGVLRPRQEALLYDGCQKLQHRTLNSVSPTDSSLSSIGFHRSLLSPKGPYRFQKTVSREGRSLDVPALDNVIRTRDFESTPTCSFESIQDDSFDAAANAYYVNRNGIYTIGEQNYM